MDKTFSGQQLKSARLAAGLSLRGLHNRIRGAASAQSLSLYERGEVEPKPSLVRTLAAALAIPVERLFLSPSVVLTHARYRARPQDDASLRQLVESRIQLAMPALLESEQAVGRRILGADALPVGNAEHPTSPVSAEAAALALRSHWGLGVAPLPNLVDLLERRGFRVLGISVDGFDGCVADLEFASTDGSGSDRQELVLTFNPDHWGERTRFTLAYELAQLLFPHLDHPSADISAKWFAGAFLMPRVLIHEYFGRRRSKVGWAELFHSKSIFGVSVQALTHRCRELGVFDGKLHKALFNSFEDLGWRQPPFQEPHFIPKGTEKPRILLRLATRAVCEDSMSITQAAAVLGVEESELTHEIETLA